jgi:hypothetical protein
MLYLIKKKDYNYNKKVNNVININKVKKRTLDLGEKRYILLLI